MFELRIVNTGNTPVKPIKIKTHKALKPYLDIIRDSNQENVMVVSLNSLHEIIQTRIISIGLVSEALVHSREVFRGAILDNAESIVLIHNHPMSNRVKPSQADKSMTLRLRQAGEILGIKVWDHIIVTSKKARSMNRKRNW